MLGAVIGDIVGSIYVKKRESAASQAMHDAGGTITPTPSGAITIAGTATSGRGFSPKLSKVPSSDSIHAQ